MEAGWTWFDLNWPWIGLVVSVLLLLLLFATNILRSTPTISRWFDPVWLAWMAPAAYMLHQFEEYGIDAHGTRFAFPDLLCSSVGLPPYPACSLPQSLFIAINIPAIWIVGILCGLLSRRHPFVGLGLYGIHFTNAISHLMVALGSFSYNPGAIASALISLPLSLWVAYACFVKGGMRRFGMAILVIGGTLFSVILLATISAYARGYLSTAALLAIQIFNPFLVILIPWLFEKRVLGQNGASSLGDQELV